MSAVKRVANIMVDVETDGPNPGDYSMIAIGAVVVEPGLARRFRGLLRPISERWVPETLAISGYTREQTLAFPEASAVMIEFDLWVRENGADRPVLISDNNGWDFGFVNWYLHHFTGGSPFGHTSQNLGSLYKGLVKDTRKNFKHLRRTRHDHDPLNDAIGNAEALLHMRDQMGLRITLGDEPLPGPERAGPAPAPEPGRGGPSR